MSEIEEQNEQTEPEFLPQMEIERWVRYHTPAELYARLKEKVFGQDEALQQASIIIYSFLKNVSSTGLDTHYHFLIEGSSGCGKSTFANALQYIVPCPVIIADASQITASGYKGVDASDLLVSDELDKWWGCGILILDELDKLMEPVSSSTHDNFHRQGLETFLKILDGGRIMCKDGASSINCSRLLVIGMGAFTPAREVQTNPKRVIGFRDTFEAPATIPAEQELSKLELSNFCGSEQFMGRFLSVIHFKEVGKEVYQRIVKNTLQEIRLIYGYDAFDLPQSLIDDLVDTAQCSDFGCRGIRSLVWELFLKSNQVIKAEDTEKIQAFFNERERMQNALLNGSIPVQSASA